MNKSNTTCCPVLSRDSQRCNALYFGPVYTDTQVTQLIAFLSRHGHVLSTQKRFLAQTSESITYYVEALFISSTVSSDLLAKSSHFVGQQRIFATRDLHALRGGLQATSDIVNLMTENTEFKPACIHVKGLRPWMPYKELKAFFEGFGPIHKLKLFRDRRDYGFLSFKNHSSYLSAISTKSILFQGTPLILTGATQDQSSSVAIPSDIRHQCLHRNKEHVFHQELFDSSPPLASKSDPTTEEDNYAEQFVEHLEDESLEDSFSDNSRDQSVHQPHFPGTLDFSEDLTQREAEKYAKLVGVKDRTLVEVSQVVTTTIRLKKNGINYQKAFTDTNAWVYFPTIE